MFVKLTHHSSTLQVAESADIVSECDPSVALPVDSYAREVRILQGAYQPQFLKYNVKGV